MIVPCDDEIGLIIVYMSDCHSVRASKTILLLAFTLVLIIQMCHILCQKYTFLNCLCEWVYFCLSKYTG